MCVALASRTIIGSLNDEFKTDLYEFFVSAHNMPRHDNFFNSGAFEENTDSGGFIENIIDM